MENLLMTDVQYKVETTARGVWRRFVYPNGQLFEEFVSHGRVWGLPLLHFTRGVCPETGKRVVARGVLAIGRRAVGIIAIGQAAVGFIAIGQLAIGVILGLGQATSGVLAIGQLALGAVAGLGQAATGHVVVAQFGFGTYVLAQFGWGTHVWDSAAADPAAEDFFRSLLGI